jgi:hypothetical protein
MGMEEAIGMILVPLMIAVIGFGYLFMAFAWENVVERMEEKEYQQGDSSRCPDVFGDCYMWMREVEEIAEREERGELDEAIAKLPPEERNARIERALIDVRAAIKRFEEKEEK